MSASAPEVPLSRRTGAMALVGAWILFFARQIFSGDVPYYRDHLVTNVPLRQYIRDRLLQGDLPQWYPYESLGVPVIGQIALGTFHPFTFLLLPFSAVTAEKWALLLSYLIGLIGAYRLGRALGTSRFAALIGAMAFAFGGYALGVSSIITYAISQSTLPWVAWACLRVARKQRLKDAALLGAIWSLVFLAGDAIGFALAGSFGLLALLDRPSKRGALLLVAGGVVASLMVGIELWPATRIAAEALRNVGQPSPTMGLTWAFHPMRAFEFFIPGFIPDEVRFRVVRELFSGHTAVFATTLFAGGIALVLAASGLSRDNKLALGFAVLLVIAMLFALGDRGGLLPLARKVLPVFTRFRYPERYLAFFWVSLSGLCALGVDRVLRATRAAEKTLAPNFTALARHRFILTASLPALLCAFAGSAGLAGLAWKCVGRELTDDRVRALVDGAWVSGLGWTAAFLLLAGVVLLSPKTRPALALLVFAELWHGNAHHLPLVDRSLFETPTTFAEAIRATQQPNVPLGRVVQETAPFFDSTVTGPGRERWVSGMLHLMKADASGVFGLTGLNSNLGALQLRHGMLLGAREEHLLRWSALLNGCFHVVRAARAPDNALRFHEELGLALLEVPCSPRAFFAGVTSASTMEMPKDRLIWENGPSLPDARGRIEWVENSPETIRLRTETEAPAALILSNDFIPGWSAAIDGAPIEIHPTQLTIQGVEVPAGKHDVVFSYRTPRLAFGAASTTLGLLTSLALCVIGKKRDRLPIA